MLSLQQFEALYTNQHNTGDTDQNKGQCTGLVELWIDNLQLAHIWGNAKDLFANADKTFFDKVINTPDNIPDSGNIIIWNEKEGNGLGHCGIVDHADIYHFVSFDQNWTPGAACQLVRHDYANITGWLKPKQIEQSCEEQLIEANKLKDEFYNNWQNALHQISDLQQEIQQLKNHPAPPPKIPELANYIYTGLNRLGFGNGN